MRDRLGRLLYNLVTKCEAALPTPTQEADIARINKTAVLHEATEAARRVQFVSQDPAVVKAAKEAGQDLVQAVRSCTALSSELYSSWYRSAA